MQNLCNLLEFDYQIMENPCLGDTDFFGNKENMAQQIQLKFNDPAPDVKLLGADGKPVQLSSLWQDKVLVLAFTRHFGCPQCKEMVDQLIDAHQALTERGLRLAIISHASAESAKEFCDLRAPSAICLADPDRSAYHAYGLYQGNFWQTLLSPNIWTFKPQAGAHKRIQT